MHSLSPSGSDPEVAKRTKELFPKNFRDYPGGVEYFDVYSPTISSLYSQVFWKALDPSPLPEDVVKEYDGKAMAIVGFEVDQGREEAAFIALQAVFWRKLVKEFGIW